MINLSTGAFYERGTRQIGGLRQRAETLQEQLGSGERLTRSSQDPVAAARLRSLARSEALAGIDQVNSDRATSELKLVDSALGSMANVIGRARELAVLASSASVSDTQRAAIGKEIEDLGANLLTIANGRNAAGHALFGGEGAGQAYEKVGPTVTYRGTNSAKAVDIGEGQQVTPTLTGPEVLNFEVNGVPTDLFAVLGTLAGALQGGAPDPLAASRDALGALDAGLEKLTTAQTIVGGRMTWVEMMDQRRQVNGELIADERNTIGGADPALTIMRLKEVMTVLEASQASFVQLSGLSLFNQLR